MVDFRRAAHDRKSIIIEYLLSAAESRKEITEALTSVYLILYHRKSKSSDCIYITLCAVFSFFVQQNTATARDHHITHTHSLIFLYFGSKEKAHPKIMSMPSYINPLDSTETTIEAPPRPPPRVGQHRKWLYDRTRGTSQYGDRRPPCPCCWVPVPVYWYVCFGSSKDCFYDWYFE